MKVFKAIDFLKCRKELNSFGFSDEEIEKVFEELEITKESLTDLKGFKAEPKYYNVYEVTKKNHTYRSEEWKGEYKRDININGIECRIPANYQGLKHGKIIEKLLQNKFEWFGSFQKDKSYIEKVVEIDFLNRLDLSKLTDEQKNMSVNDLIKLSKKEVIKKESAWSLYELYSEDYEIYLATELGTLYVPIKALLNKDFQTIKNRMLSYALDYFDPINLKGFSLNHKGRTKEEYKKDQETSYNKMISVLESKEAKQLKKYLS